MGTAPGPRATIGPTGRTTRLPVVAGGTMRSPTSGPATLGRDIPSSPGPVGALHVGTRRLVVDSPDATLTAQLHVLARRGSAALWRLTASAAAALAQPFTTTLPPHAVGPQRALHHEQLQHLVFSRRHRPADHAHVPTTRLAISTRAVTDGRGDIELPNGSRAWLDGGPPRYTSPIGGVPVFACQSNPARARATRRRTPTPHSPPISGAAVTHDGGAAHVVGPAGSGKTRVLTEHAKGLIVQQWRIPPSAITLIAFNKRAQEEITARTATCRGCRCAR